MSGSSGGSGTGYGGGFDASPASCETLIIESRLSSPKENVVAKFEEGDLLDVQLQGHPEIVVVCLYEGEVAGGVASPDVSKLRECIEGGTRYAARVLSKREGQVRIRITAI